MTWGWNVKHPQSLDVGGNLGSSYESSHFRTWPNYDAAYLAKRLGAGDNAVEAYDDRFKAAEHISDSAARAVYLDQVTENYKQEADECLKQEFVQWLQGNHEANAHPNDYYENKPGKPKRRAIRPEDGKSVGEVINNWQATPWGRNQMTHLDGVREFLRENTVRAEEHEFAMNVLAEFGPQNIEQAWTYFKHWVKGRPVAPEMCIHESQDPDQIKRSGPTQMAEPRHVYNKYIDPTELKEVFDKPPPTLPPKASDDAKAPEVNLDTDRLVNALNKVTDTLTQLNVQQPKAPLLQPPAAQRTRRDYFARRQSEDPPEEYTVGKDAFGYTNLPALTNEQKQIVDRAREADARGAQRDWVTREEASIGALEAVDELEESEGNSRVARLTNALTPGPVAGAVAEAAFEAGRLTVGVAARGTASVLRSATNYLIQPQNTSLSIEDNGSGVFDGNELLQPGGWRELGFRPLSERGRYVPYD